MDEKNIMYCLVCNRIVWKDEVPRACNHLLAPMSIADHIAIDLQSRRAEMLSRHRHEALSVVRRIKSEAAMAVLLSEHKLKAGDLLIAVDDGIDGYPAGTELKIVDAGIYSDGLSVNIVPVLSNLLLVGVPIETILEMRKAYESTQCDG